MWLKVKSLLKHLRNWHPSKKQERLCWLLVFALSLWIIAKVFGLSLKSWEIGLDSTLYVTAAILATLGLTISFLALRVSRNRNKTVQQATKTAVNSASPPPPVVQAPAATPEKKKEKTPDTKSSWSFGKVVAWTMIFVVASFTIIGVTQIIARAISSSPQTQQTSQSTRLPVPEDAIEFYVTSNEQEVRPASKGKNWRIELNDPSDILEFRGVKILSDGTQISIGKPWRSGGSAGTSANFPAADRYFVKIVNKQESKYLWFEH